MRRIAAAAVALVTSGWGLVALAGGAGATTIACINSPGPPFCAGVESQQPVHLQLWTSGVVGSVILAKTPAFTRGQDWRIHPGHDNGVSVIEWAPRGVLSGKCVTVVADVKRAAVRLEPCVHGTAGSSHQRWRHVEHPNGDYNYISQADGLALAVAGDTSGSAVQIRTPSLHSGSQRFRCTTSAP